MRRASVVAGWLLCGLLCWASPAVADVLVDWNSIASQAVGAAGAARPGPSGLIDLAMVQLAVHDAMQAYQGRFESYAGTIVNLSGSASTMLANFFGRDKHTFSMTSAFVHPVTGQTPENPASTADSPKRPMTWWTRAFTKASIPIG